jgi:uncharacterized protein (DUF58 family)
VNPDPPPRRPGRARTWLAVVAGVGGGVAVVVITRAVFGPDAVPFGAAVGVVAMVVGILASWKLSGGARGRIVLASGGRLRHRLHPVAWFGPVAGSVVAMLAWAGVAHSSGSGWVQAIGAVLAAVLVIGLVMPALPARAATVSCVASPSDGEAGRPVTLTMTANGPVRLRPRYPTGEVARAGGPPHGRRTVEMEVVPDRRGILGSVAVELASCAPFGILWWAREVEVPLPWPLHVAPRSGEPGRLPSQIDLAAGEAPLWVPATVGEPRGVRPYEPGDARHSVHWPATSHTGTLMVRETERRTDDPLVVDVVLPADRLEAEAVSERAMATVGGELARGRPVILGTLEADGRVTRLVRDRIDLGRRLARATSPPAPPTPTSPGRRGRRHPGQGP